MEFITQLDRSTLEALYAVRDPLLVQILIWVSELGRVPTIAGLTCIAILTLFLKRHYAYAAGLAVSVATSGIAIFLAKGFIERVRPDEFYQAYTEAWYSFPSAHAALAAALYGFLMYITWYTVESPLKRSAVMGIGTIAIGAIAFSRLYLGVHFLSDVVAGLLLGMLCVWLGVRWSSFAHKI